MINARSSIWNFSSHATTANLAERRYAACDPDNRLIAAQLEKNWEITPRRVRDLEARQPTESSSTIEVDPCAFANMAENLSAACPQAARQHHAI